MDTEIHAYKVSTTHYINDDGCNLTEDEAFAKDQACGRWVREEKTIAHHDYQPYVQEEGHLQFETIYFTDGSSYSVTGPDDPNIGADGWIDNGDGRTQLGADQAWVVDEPEIKEEQAYDELEETYTWTLYTEEELAEIAKGSELDRIRALESETAVIATLEQELHVATAAIAELGVLVATELEADVLEKIDTGAIEEIYSDLVQKGELVADEVPILWQTNNETVVEEVETELPTIN